MQGVEVAICVRNYYIEAVAAHVMAFNEARLFAECLGTNYTEEATRKTIRG